MTKISYYHSPVGYLKLVANDTGLTGCYFLDEEPQEIAETVSHPVLSRTHQQLSAYFHQGLQVFTLPLYLQGTAFRQQAWQALQTIPYGKTASYVEMANKIGHPKAARAIGQANHHNPISIIVPCHRVINHNGKLGGYGGGLWRKEWLLEHERKHFSKNTISHF